MNFKEWLLLIEKTMLKDQEFRDPLLALKYIQKTHPNPENLAVTFTEIDKVGINPQTKHKTPLGIYLYPLNYVIERKMNVPFVKDQPYINVCEFIRPEKILHMTSDKSNQNLYHGKNNQDGMELLNVFPKEQVDQAIENIENVDGAIRSNYSKLWLVTQILANKNPIQWNANLRKCGIVGFIDHGTGTIHMNEKTQCVVFTTSALKLLHSINNLIYDGTYYDSYAQMNQRLKTFKYDINKMSDEQIVKLLQSRRHLDLGSLISSSNNKEKFSELIVKYKLELSDNDVKDLIDSAINKDKFSKLIIEKKPKLSGRDIFTLFFSSKEKDAIAELIIKKQPEIIDDKDTYEYFIKYAIDQYKTAKLIIEMKPELTNNNVKYLLKYATDKNKMAELIIKYKPELSDNDVYNFLNPDKETDEEINKEINKDKIVELIIEKKPELSDNDVYFLLKHATDIDEIAKLIQEKEDNISKLSDTELLDLIDLSNDKKRMAQIINKYHTKKTPEIQELIDRYLHEL